MPIPVSLRDESFPEPGAAGSHDAPRLYYVLAANGVFLGLNNDWVHALVPLKLFEEKTGTSYSGWWRRDEEQTAQGDIPALIQKPKAKFKPPAMPAALFYQIAKFFREVRDKHKTEVAVLLHYGEGKGWAVTVPSQEVTAGHVSYEVKPTDRVPGYRMIGTMHSHVDMSAFHSGTDIADEAQFDGLHVTLGKMNDLPKSLHLDAEIVIRGYKFKAKPKLWLAGGFETEPDKDEWSNGTMTLEIKDRELWNKTVVPAEWHDPVKAETNKWTNKFWGGGMGDYEGSEYGGMYGEYGGDKRDDLRNRRGNGHNKKY